MAESQAPVRNDPELPHRLRSLYQQARAKRRNRIDKWQRAYRLVHNMAWSPLREAWLPAPSASEIFPILAALCGWMTDNKPGFDLIPAMPPGTPIAFSLSQVADDLKTVLDACWTNYDWDGELEKVLWDAQIYGTGFMKAIWNPALADGLGDASTIRVDPFCMFPDPAAHSFDDANYIIEARRMSMQELDRRFPGSAKKLIDGEVPSGESLDQRDDPMTYNRFTPMANTGAISPVTAPSWGLPGEGAKEKALWADGVVVYECWLREHKATPAKGKQPARMVDEWRLVMMVGNMILVDAPAKALYGHGQHPYSRFVLQEFGEFWGISLVDHLAPLQVSLNRLLAAVQSNAELIGNPILMDNASSGVSRTKVINRPGQRLTTNGGQPPANSVAWLSPPGIPDYIMSQIAWLQGEMERVSGLSSIVKGNEPNGRPAEGVMDSVAESAFVRIRSSLRSLERVLRDQGRKLASLIAENYTEPRLVSIVGENGENTYLQINKEHFYARDLDQEAPAPFRFTVLVGAGGNSPISREKRQADAMRLFALGALDQIALLDAFDYPNRQQIVQRVQSLQASGQFQPPGARQRAH